MIYIVTGPNRSGTNMVAHALTTGGIPVQKDEELCALKEAEFADKAYHGNPNGFFEGGKHCENPAEGHVLKLMPHQISKLPEGEYTVVLVYRNPHEVRDSWHRFVRFIDDSVDPKSVEEEQEYLYKHLSLRPDVKFTTLQYENIIKDPVGAFTKLRGFGFPIDPEKAASVVDPKLYRNRYNPETKEVVPHG